MLLEPPRRRDGHLVAMALVLGALLGLPLGSWLAFRWMGEGPPAQPVMVLERRVEITVQGPKNLDVSRVKLRCTPVP